MCSAAALLLWLSVSQSAGGGASLSPADATPGLRQRSSQLRTPEEESPPSHEHRRLFTERRIKQNTATFPCRSEGLIAAGTYVDLLSYR